MNLFGLNIKKVVSNQQSRNRVFFLDTTKNSIVINAQSFTKGMESGVCGSKDSINVFVC